MARFVSDYFSSDMDKARVARGCKFVVHVELPNFRGSGELGFEELDADDLSHASRLAEEWVNGALGRSLGSHSASAREVSNDGSLAMNPLFIVSQYFYDDEVGA